MRNLKDNKTKIYPSIMRGGKELSSSSALDSPSVLSKLATPTPAIDPDMSHVITTKKYTSVMIRVCHNRSRFLSCMYIHDDFMTE